MDILEFVRTLKMPGPRFECALERHWGVFKPIFGNELNEYGYGMVEYEDDYGDICEKFMMPPTWLMLKIMKDKYGCKPFHGIYSNRHKFNVFMELPAKERDLFILDGRRV